MNFKFFFVVLFLLLIGHSACSDEQEKTEATEQSGSLEEALRDEDFKVSGLEDAIKAIEDKIEGIKNGEEVEVIDYRELKKLLPETLVGMKRVKHKGAKTGIMGFKYSTAEAEYKKDQKVMEIDIIDTGDSGVAKIGLAAWSTLEIDSESDDGYQRTFQEDEIHYFEEFDVNQKRYSLKALAGERLLIDITSRNMEPKMIKKIINGFKLNQLF